MQFLQPFFRLLAITFIDHSFFINADIDPNYFKMRRNFKYTTQQKNNNWLIVCFSSILMVHKLHNWTCENMYKDEINEINSSHSCLWIHPFHSFHWFDGNSIHFVPVTQLIPIILCISMRSGWILCKKNYVSIYFNESPIHRLQCQLSIQENAKIMCVSITCTNRQLVAKHKIIWFNLNPNCLFFICFFFFIGYVQIAYELVTNI